MAEFSKLVVTRKGQALIAKILAGTATDIDFVSVAASDASYSVDELEGLESLSAIMQESEISRKTRTNEVAVKVETAFSNTDLTVGYHMRTLGLFANDPDEGKILYAATVETSGNCYMPPYNGITVSGAYIKLITTVGNADEVSLEVDPGATATIGDIQDLQKQIDNLLENGLFGPQITITTTKGSTVHYSDGVENLTTIAGEDGTVVVKVPRYGTWNIYATLDGQTTSTQPVIVDTAKLYYLRLEYFSATLTVTALSGSTVTVTDGSQTFSEKSDGTAVFALNVQNTYTVYAEYENARSETKTVVIDDPQDDYTETVNFIVLTVTADAGSNITVAKGDVTKQAVSVLGVAVFYLPSTGSWAVTATLSGRTATANVNCSNYTNYTVKLDYYKYVGVRITKSNENPESALTYIGDAIGMTPGADGWATSPIFKNIKPCLVKNGEVQYYLNPNNLAERESGGAATITDINSGDVMIEIPKLGFKMTTDGAHHDIYITEDPSAEGYCYRAHSLDEEGDCDKIYIGAFLAYNSSSKLYSVSGKTPTANITLTNARTYAQARGTGYQLLSFYPLLLLQCLYTIRYKNLHGQNAIGRGYVDGNSGAIVTGGTVDSGVDYGETTGKKQMCFLNIEDFWGNLRQWVDGLHSDSNCNIKTAFKDFNDDGSGYPFTKASDLTFNTSGWIDDIQGTNEGGFIVKVVRGSSTIKYTDVGGLYADSVVDFGGHYDYGDSAGPFYHIAHLKPSYSNSNLGSRLIYKHKAA